MPLSYLLTWSLFLRTWNYLFQKFFVSCLDENGSVVLEKKIILTCQCHFTKSLSFSIVFLQLRILCANLSWNWNGGSGEDEHVKCLQTDRWFSPSDKVYYFKNDIPRYNFWTEATEQNSEICPNLQPYIKQRTISANLEHEIASHK